MGRPLRVGIVGVAPKRGWAAVAHVPALQALPDYEITAVCTRSKESAAVVAAQFGVPHSMNDPVELAAHRDVDLVAICMSAPGHEAALRAALPAGKPIFCEWPLCASTSVATEMVALAARNSVRTIIGLQARAAPTLAFAKDLIADGYVGRVLSCMATSSWRIWGGATPAFNAYTLDRKNGASALTIAGGHTMDAIQHCVAPFKTLSATVAGLRKEVTILETGEKTQMSAPQQFVVHGELESGAIASVHLQGGARKGFGLHIEINGTDGDLLITSDDQFGVTNAELTLRGLRAPDFSLETLVPPPSYLRTPRVLRGSRAQGTALLYLDFAEAIGSGREAHPNFQDALKLHRMLDAIEHASESGQRQTLS